MVQLKQNYYILLVLINFITYCENIENNVLSNCLALRQAFIHSNGNLAPEDLRAFGACIDQDARFGYNGGLTRKELSQNSKNGSLAFLGYPVADHLTGDIPLGMAYAIDGNGKAVLNYIKALSNKNFKEQISEIIIQSSLKKNFNEISDNDYKQLIEHTVNARHIDLNTIEAYEMPLIELLLMIPKRSFEKIKILKHYGANLKSINKEIIKDDISFNNNLESDASNSHMKGLFQERNKNDKAILNLLEKENN